MDFTIREIEHRDYQEVLSLWINELNFQAVNSEIFEIHHERVKEDDRYKTFVALHEDKVIGFVTTVQSFAVGFEVGFIHLTGIAVKSELQNKGIGTRLLKHIEAYGKARGVHNIILNSGVKRTDAHAFYERNGYDRGSWCFSKRL